MANFNATFKNKKGANAFEGIIVTSDSGFFERLGYVKGEPMPPKVRQFFDAAYAFVLKEIGYNGTDLNVLSAVVHLDETTPHLQLYYIPIVDVGKKKIYAKDENGKVIRNENGSPVQERGANGKTLYEYVELEQPKVCSSDFWQLRGGYKSFGHLQDRFYDDVSVRFGLERGEKGSDRENTTKYQWEEQEREKAIRELEERKLQLSAELEPLEEMVTAFKEALNGEKPSSKKKLQLQVSGLIYKYSELERQHKLTVKDNETLFNELYGLKQEFPQLEEYAELMKFLERNAPDKLAEAKDTAIERQRNRYTQNKGKNSGNYK